MGKILAFVLATIGLSLAILIPCYYFFEAMVIKIQEAGIYLKSIDFLWEGFGILAFVVVVIVATLMALIVWGEKHVL
jgi:hypothetical protein